jgi:hypothetical protein
VKLSARRKRCSTTISSKFIVIIGLDITCIAFTDLASNCINTMNLLVSIIPIHSSGFGNLLCCSN